MANRWYNRPDNLRRIWFGQLGAVTVGTLEASRRLLGGDYQWYTGPGIKDRPDSAWDKFWSETVFGETEFVTPDKLPQDSVLGKRLRGESKAKRNIISPDQSNKKRSSDTILSDRPSKRPHLLDTVRIMSDRTHKGPGTNEDPVIPPPKKISNVAPDYFTFKGRVVIYKQYSLSTVDRSTGVNSNTAKLYQEVRIRLNSPADINLDLTSGDESNKELNGFDKWKTFYSHYRVLRTNVRVTFMRREGITADKDTAGSTDLGGWSIPVIVGFVCDPSARLSIADTKDYRPLLAGKHIAHDYLGKGGRTSFTYSYTPESWDQSIERVAEDGIWTPTSKNPSSNDLLHIFCMPASTYCAGDVQAFIEVEQEVQMKQYTDTFLNDIYGSAAPAGTADNMNTDGS
jgi:hypothetical protein